MGNKEIKLTTAMNMTFLLALMLGGCDTSSEPEGGQPLPGTTQRVPATDSPSVEEQKSQGSRAKEEIRQEERTSATSGPFGVSMGDPIGKAEGITPGGVPYADIPKENLPAWFETATVYGTKTTGACLIRASMTERNVDSGGVYARERIDDLAERLTKKYGTPKKKYSFLQAGSIWNRSQYWMMALLRRERTHAYFWTLEAPIGGVEALSVRLRAADATTAIIDLQYEFTNANQCVEEGAAKVDAAL